MKKTLAIIPLALLMNLGGGVAYAASDTDSVDVAVIYHDDYSFASAKKNLGIAISQAPDVSKILAETESIVAMKESLKTANEVYSFTGEKRKDVLITDVPRSLKVEGVPLAEITIKGNSAKVVDKIPPEAKQVFFPVEAPEEDLEKVIEATNDLLSSMKNLTPYDNFLINQDFTLLEKLDTESLYRVNDLMDDEKITQELIQRIINEPFDEEDEQNGEISEGKLQNLSWVENERLAIPAAKSFELLNKEFKKEFGHDIKIVDTYRPLNEQYIVNKQSPGMTAIPGTSNHGWGLAVDIGETETDFISFSSPAHSWMMENGPKFGWWHPSWAGPETSRPEPWHFEFGTSYGTDKDFRNTVSGVHRIIKEMK